MEAYQKIFSLVGKTAIVTGASGILGSEFCKALCSHGARVMCFDVNEPALTALVDTLNAKFGSASASGFVCNVADADDVRLNVDMIASSVDKIDILLNNAATKTDDLSKFFTSFSDYSLQLWRDIMAVNLDGMFLMAQAVGKHMLKQKQGVIVQTASIYALLGPDQRIYQGSSYLNQEINTPAVYSASKAGVIGLTRHLASLWGRDGIRVNALCPGGVASGQNDIFNQQYSARIPLGRMANAADIVGPMLFLVSQAASYVTGQILYADGGLSAW